jgi:heme oxygenase
MSSGNQFVEFAKRLREATRPAHIVLDHHYLLAPLTRANLSMADYAKALAALHGPHCAIESVLCGFAPETEFPSRLPDLESDLNTLGTKAIPLSTAAAEFNSNEELIGAMYVIEGSNLGGAVISRLLEKSLSPNTPKRFFRNSGGTERWARYQQFASRYWHEESFGLIVEAANKTFMLYKNHLDSC